MTDIPSTTPTTPTTGDTTPTSLVYATLSDYYAIYPQEETVDLTTLDNPSALLPENKRIEKWLKLASAEIRVKLGLPDDSQIKLDVFEMWCVDIARYGMDSYNPREDVVRRYESAIKQMKRLVDDGVLRKILTGDTIDTPVMSIWVV